MPVDLPRLIAFYLPQFHPIPENDAWWGPGFTEWTNVVRARPRFAGHDQPRLPADLGFYDLRLPEAREAQAQLARAYGVGAFCYYHYWFAGRRLLGRPLDEVLASGKPDFPFCLCWANEPWSRHWDGGHGEILVAQHYSIEDDRRHIEWLLHVFEDPRYVRLQGRPLLLVYRASQWPEPRRTAELWREAARRRGFPDLVLCRVESFIDESGDPAALGFDAAVEFQPDRRLLRDGRSTAHKLFNWRRLWNRATGRNVRYYYEYRELVAWALAKPAVDYRRFPCVAPSWDNTARRGRLATVIHGSTPELYEQWLAEVLGREIDRAARAGGARASESLVFINAWNEWAEGCYLEPDQRFGRGYLEATRRAVQRAAARLQSARACSSTVADPSGLMPSQRHAA